MTVLEKIFSYCWHCWCAQYFTLVKGIWVCEECGKPLQKAINYGTIVTPEPTQEVYP